MKVAKRNAKKHQVNIKFLQSDLLQHISNVKKFDVIVANLPYISQDSSEIQASVKKHEPSLALFGGADGLDLIRKLLLQISELPKKPRLVLLEFGGGEQVDILRNFVERIFPKARFNFLRDLAGVMRVLCLREL